MTSVVSQTRSIFCFTNHGFPLIEASLIQRIATCDVIRKGLFMDSLSPFPVFSTEVMSENKAKLLLSEIKERGVRLVSVTGDSTWGNHGVEGCFSFGSNGPSVDLAIRAAVQLPVKSSWVEEESDFMRLVDLPQSTVSGQLLDDYRFHSI